nr:hypothetical protein [uncultured Nocardioides sp.]
MRASDSGGRTVVHDGGRGYRVLDVRSGDTLMTVPGSADDLRLAGFSSEA